MKVFGRIVLAALMALSLQAATPSEYADWQAATAGGTAAFKSGNYALAEQSFAAALKMAEQFPQPDSRLSQSLNDLAILYVRQNKRDLAIPLMVRAINAIETFDRPDAPGLATLISNLAEVYGAQQKYTESASLYERALTIEEKNNDTTAMGATLNRLGALYKDQGEYEKAEPYLVRSVELLQKDQTTDKNALVVAMNNLALLYREEGWYEAASQIYQNVLVMRQQMNCPPEKIAEALDNIGDLANERGSYDAARTAYTQALTILETSLGKNAPQLSDTLVKMMSMLSAAGKMSEAESAIQRAVDVLSGAPDPDEEKLGSALNDLGLLYREEGKLAESENAFQRAAEMFRKAKGESAETANALNNLAKVEVSAGKFKEAELAFKEALGIRQKVLGPNDLSVASTMRNYAMMLQSLNRKQEAASMNAQAARIEKRNQ